MGIKSGEEHSFELLLSVGSELVHALLVGVSRVSVMLLNGFHVHFKDAQAVSQILSGQVEHEPMNVPPLVKHLRRGLFHSSLPEQEEGSECEGESEHDSFLHIYLEYKDVRFTIK